MIDTVVEQVPLLDLNGRELNAMWVDENQPLFIPNNPLHWKAHKLQIALAKMEKQQERNPAQFNSTTYLAMLNQYTEVMDEVNKELKIADANKLLESGEVAQGGTERSGSEEICVGESNGVDPGISADNPFAGKGLPST